MGSVADKVVRAAPCPVLTLRLSEESTGRPVVRRDFRSMDAVGCSSQGGGIPVRERSRSGVDIHRSATSALRD